MSDSKVGINNRKIVWAAIIAGLCVCAVAGVFVYSTWHNEKSEDTQNNSHERKLSHAESNRGDGITYEASSDAKKVKYASASSANSGNPGEEASSLTGKTVSGAETSSPGNNSQSAPDASVNNSQSAADASVNNASPNNTTASRNKSSSFSRSTSSISVPDEYVIENQEVEVYRATDQSDLSSAYNAKKMKANLSSGEASSGGNSESQDSFSHLANAPTTFSGDDSSAGELSSHACFSDRNLFDNEPAIQLSQSIFPANQTPVPTVSPETVNELINGKHAMSFSVVDSAGSNPIKDYAVNCQIYFFKPQNPENSGIEIYKNDKSDYYTIGHLESQVIHNEDGFCFYENIPEGKYSLEIYAHGYIKKQVEVLIPSEKEAFTIEMEAPAKITGRVIDGASRQPVRNVRVNIEYNNDELKYLNTTQATGSDGRFLFEQMSNSTHELSMIKMGEIRQSRNFSTSEKNTEGEYDLADFFSYNCMEGYPRDENGIIDYGDIIFHRYPTLQLEVVDEQNKPMANFPFSIGYDSRKILIFNKITDDKYKSGTDISSFTRADGRREITLTNYDGYEDPMYVFLPDRRDNYYSTPESKFEIIDCKGYDENWLKKNFDEIFPQNFRTYETDPVTLKKLTQQNIDYHLESIKNYFENMRKLPEHPNAKLFKPLPDRVVKIRMIYRKTPEDASLRLFVKDKSTGDPIPKFWGNVFFDKHDAEGMLDEKKKRVNIEKLKSFRDMEFENSDGTGKLEIYSLPIVEELLIREKSHRENPGEYAYDKSSDDIYINISAPEYVKKNLKIPFQDIKAGKEIVIQLEKHAIVKGRVLFTQTAQPFTSGTLQQNYEYMGHSKSFFNESDTTAYAMIYSGRLAKIRLENTKLAANDRNSDRDFYKGIYEGETLSRRDGNFAIGKLEPDKNWNLAIEVPGFIRYVNKNLELKPGVNDLGDIYIDLAGFMEGMVVDQKGNPLPETKVYICSCREADSSKTDKDGLFKINLNDCDNKKEDEIIRIIPPWNRMTNPEDMYSNLVLETRKFIPDTAYADLYYYQKRKINYHGEQYFPVIHQGNDLKIVIDSKKNLYEYIKYYSDVKNLLSPQRYVIKGTEKIHCAFQNLSLQGLEENNSGLKFSSSINFYIDSKDITTNTITLNMPHIPPGRFTMCITGRFFFTTVETNEYGTDPERSFCDLEIENPIMFYQEFIMPDSSHKLELQNTSKDVTFRFKGETDLSGRMKDKKIKVLLERIISGAVGYLDEKLFPDYQFVVSAAGKDKDHSSTKFKNQPNPEKSGTESKPMNSKPEEKVTDVKTDDNGPTRFVSDKKPVVTVSEPYLIKRVFPGTYKLKAYLLDENKEEIDEDSFTYYETNIDITEEEKTQEIVIPCPKE